jgi:hypothetical protein
MKLIYIAGPFRGDTGWAIEENVRQAERFALQVWKMGLAAICPHCNTRMFFGEIDEDLALRGCLEILARCDGVLFIPGWEGSEGANVEWQEALRLKIPIYWSLSELMKTVTTP